MTNEEAKKMLEAKLECLKNETSGINHDCNMRLCDGCSLNYEQGNMGEQKDALYLAIKALEATEQVNTAHNGVQMFPKGTFKSVYDNDDCISRSEVHALIATWLSDYLTDETREALETINYKIGDMPPVTPKQNTGMWIIHPLYNDLVCSKCLSGAPYKSCEANYCPNCGAKMKESED